MHSPMYIYTDKKLLHQPRSIPPQIQMHKQRPNVAGNEILSNMSHSLGSDGTEGKTMTLLRCVAEENSLKYIWVTLLKMGSYSSITMCQYCDNHLIY